MPNERLRATMIARGLSAQALAEKAEIDPKTVERWISLGRTPYVKTAVRAADVLGEDPVFLWPDLHKARVTRSASPELIALYGQRAEVAPAIWRAFFDHARHNIDILVYAANHLHESLPGFNSLLASKAEQGCTIRVALGDADSPNVTARGLEERFGDGIESRCRLALLHYQPLIGTANIEVRTHATTLYNSVYRSDDELLVNAHVWGVNAFGSPVWHVRSAPAGTMFPTYTQSFEAVWDRATPVA